MNKNPKTLTGTKRLKEKNTGTQRKDDAHTTNWQRGKETQRLKTQEVIYHRRDKTQVRLMSQIKQEGNTRGKTTHNTKAQGAGTTK